MNIRNMAAEDYDEVFALWLSIKNFAIRSIDDSREGVERFIKRNPTTSIVAEENGRIVGAILCGHDGRRACFYHVCVAPDCRKQGIGRTMVAAASEALRKEGICKINLIAFRNNAVGNAFWKSQGWILRDDVNYYDFILEEANKTEYVK